MSYKLKKMVDKLICDWSMDTGTALKEENLNDLVDRVSLFISGYFAGHKQYVN